MKINGLPRSPQSQHSECFIYILINFPSVFSLASRAVKILTPLWKDWNWTGFTTWRASRRPFCHLPRSSSSHELPLLYKGLLYGAFWTANAEISRLCGGVLVILWYAVISVTMRLKLGVSVVSPSVTPSSFHAFHCSQSILSIDTLTFLKGTRIIIQLMNCHTDRHFLMIHWSAGPRGCHSISVY